jgi:hypothetical protein
MTSVETIARIHFEHSERQGDQAHCARAEDCARYGSQGSAIWCDRVHLQAHGSAAAEARRLAAGADRDSRTGGQAAEAGAGSTQRLFESCASTRGPVPQSSSIGSPYRRLAMVNSQRCEQSHHDSFMSVPTSARFYIFVMSASLMMTTRPRRVDRPRSKIFRENISR